MLGLGSVPDLLRLLIVVLIGWTAVRDVRTRRVPNVVWPPAVALGLLLLAWEVWGRVPLTGISDRLFLIQVLLSLGFVIPLVFLFWWFGAFGGADAKAFMTIAVVFPTYPTYTLGETMLPMVATHLGVFSLTILTNTVLVALVFPVVLAIRNLVTGDVALIMALGRRIPVEQVPTAHGKLFETRHGYTRDGLDLDALRMYLRWRGATLADVRSTPEVHRDPASIDETNPPGDGAVREWDGLLSDGGDDVESIDADDAESIDGDDADDVDYDDPWGAEAFLSDIEGDAYGTTPETLREGLEVVVERDAVWISPGIPFLVPAFVGLVVALIYGDVLFGLMALAGLV